MNRLMIIARLREGAHQEAENLIAAGPPFDLEELGFHRHAAYLTAGEVVFLFEAPEVEWIVNDIVDDVPISAARSALARTGCASNASSLRTCSPGAPRTATGFGRSC